MKDSRLIIPSSLRLDTLDKIHAGQKGIRKCCDRARQSFWCPGISKQIEDIVTTWPTCCKHRKKHVEPMISTPLPERPWQKVATDLFYHSGKTYIIVVDYYSRFFDIAPLKSMTTENTMNHLRRLPRVLRPRATWAQVWREILNPREVHAKNKNKDGFPFL